MLFSAVKYYVLAVSILWIVDPEADCHRCHEQEHGRLSPAEYFGNALVYQFHIFFRSGVFVRLPRLECSHLVIWLALTYPLNKEGKRNISFENIFNSYTSTLIFYQMG